MLDWKESKLEQEIELLYGKSLPKGKREEGPVPVYGSNGIVGSHSKAFVKGPGIIIGRKGSCGEVHYSEDDFCPIDTTYYVALKKKHDLRFFYYYLKTLGLNEKNSHSTIPGLNREAVYTLDCKIPPYGEQKKIAAVLFKIQTAIEMQERIIETTRELKKSTMQHVFTCGLRWEKTKETEIGRIPESWGFTQLGEVLTECNGKIQTGPFGSQLHTTDYVKEGTPVVNPTHLAGNKINHTDLNFVNQDTVERLKRHKLKAGDILFGRRGEIGRHGLVGEDEKGWLCGTGCFLIRMGSKKINNKFISYYCSTETLVNWLCTHASGAIMPNLNNTVLKQVPLALPTIDEQNEIVAILNAIDEKFEMHTVKKSALQDLFKTMLNKLMTGEIRVKDLDVDLSGIMEGAQNE